MSHLVPNNLTPGSGSSIFEVITDNGTATAIGALSILGMSPGISTSIVGSTSVVLITAGGAATGVVFVADSGTASSSGGFIQLVGNQYVQTVATGNSLTVTGQNIGVLFGGTGRASLSTRGLLVGQGASPVSVTLAGTDGQVLIAGTGEDPMFATITSSGGTVTFSFGPNSLNIEAVSATSTFSSLISVANGGTGRTVLTSFGVLIGEGSNGVNVTAPGTDGQVFIASTIGDPAFATITSTGGTVLFTSGPNSLNIEVTAAVFTFPLPVPVGFGGTGQTILTSFGVLIGEDSNNINVTAPGSDGQILIAASGADPAFATITSSGGTVTFSYGPNSLNIEVFAAGFTFPVPVLVGSGGSGRTILTSFGVLIGEGSNNVNVTAAGTSGQILIASTTGDPKFKAITSSGNTVTFTVGPNSLNIEVNTSNLTFSTAWTVPYGGTGLTVLTTFGVLIGEGSHNVHVTAAGTDGQLLLAGTGVDPAFATLTSIGGTVTFTAGPNSLNIEVDTSNLTFSTPWTVPFGGTGLTVLTAFGVLIGEDSNNVNVTAAGTDGQMLLAATGLDPAFATLTSSGGTVAFTAGPNSLNIEVNATDFTFLTPWTVPFGGTGRTVLTTFGVLIGEGSNKVNVTAAGTSGQILIASTTGDPKFKAITSSGNTVTFTVGPNSLNIEVNAPNFTFLKPWTVPFGGTGRTVLTTFGVLLGEGSNNINVTAAGTSGQILIASTTGDPKFKTITSSGHTVTFTVGPNSLNIEVNAPDFTFLTPWTVPYGGTGLTVLTAFGVLIGEDVNNVNVTAPGIDGQMLLAGTGLDPAFATLTSSGDTIAFTVGPNSLNIEVNAPDFTFLTPWTVPYGGTGLTILTAFGVLIGEDSNNVNVTAAGTDGQLLLAGTGLDPAFATLTSIGNTVTFTVGPNSLNIEVNAPNFTFLTPWTVPFGGTGRTVLTTFGVLIGEGSNKVNVTAAGTSGQILIASTTGDPKFKAITSSGSTVTFTVGPNSLNIEVNAPNFTFLKPWTVPYGGTGRTCLTTFGVLIGEGSNNIDVTAAGTDGQMLLAGTGLDPAFATLTSSGGTVTFTVGPNSLNIEVDASNLTFLTPWTVPYGGTGLTVLTSFGVLIGEGSNNIDVTAAGTDGQMLLAGTGVDPAFATLTSSGGTVTFTVGPNSLNIEVNAPGFTFLIPWTVPFGGTGRTVLTTFGVLIGEGSNNANVTAAGTSGQLFISSTTGDPAFATITSSGGSIAFTAGPNSLNIEVFASTFTFPLPVSVSMGGTGRTGLTTFGVLIGEGSNNVNVTAAGTSGQVFIASTTGDPAFATITSSGGSVAFTVGPNSLNIEAMAAVFTFPLPVAVGIGGTGRTILTTFGVLIGEGSNNVNVTAAGTDGQLLIASTVGDPIFATLTSSGGNIIFTPGPNTLNIDVFQPTFTFPVTVPLGGTGIVVLTTFGVLIGEGSNNVNVTAAGTSGQVFIGSTTGDPAFATITSSGGTVTFTVGPNSLNIEVNAPNFTYLMPWTVPYGGTGRTVLTTFGVLLGEGSNNVDVTAAGTSGQILIASTTGNPKFTSVTSSGNTVTFTVGPNSLNIEVNAPNFTFLKPWTVPYGGTGRTILTTFGVLLGEGSNNINVTAAGTSGQILIASTTGDPKFTTLTSSGGTVTFTVGPNSLNIEVNAPDFTFLTPWTVPSGGTGLTVLTAFGVLIGEDSNNVNVTAAGTDGQMLLAATGLDPAFATLSSSGGTVAFTAGPNALNIEVNATDFTFLTPWTVPYGGTGRIVLTTFGVLVGEGSNNVNVTAAGTSGQILIASTTGDPKFKTITSSGNTVTFTVGPNSLNIDINAPNFTFLRPWTVPYGGTGRTVLTTFGVLIGEGSNNINVTAAGTSGQILIASTTGDPKFSRVTSSGNTVTFTVGPNSLNIEVNAPKFTFLTPWTVPYGGTGRTILTAFGVIIGEDSDNVNVTAAGTDGQLLLAATGLDPAFATLSSSGGTVALTVGPNALNIEVNATDFTFLTPWTVPYGGTGQIVLTTSGVLIGEGSNNVNVTAAGTDGQLLLAATSFDPAFATLTSIGNTVTFTVGPNSLNIEVNAPNFTFLTPWTVPFGGTGRTVLTTFGVLIGEGSNNVNVTAAGTHGQILIASTTGDPKFKAITSSGGTVTFTVGPNSLNIDINATNFTFVLPWNVPRGGTGRTVLTRFGVLLGEGSNNVNVTAAGTHGQVLIASTTGDPAFMSITSSGNTLTFTYGPNSLNIDSSVGPGLLWNVVTSASQTAIANNGYIANNGGTMTLLLPATTNVGSLFALTGMNNATGWRLAVASGQTIHFGTAATTVSVGYLQSTNIYDTVTLVCNVANSSFIVINSVGNITIV